MFPRIRVIRSHHSVSFTPSHTMAGRKLINYPNFLLGLEAPHHCAPPVVSTTPPHPEAPPDRPGAVAVSRTVART